MLFLVVSLMDFLDPRDSVFGSKETAFLNRKTAFETTKKSILDVLSEIFQPTFSKKALFLITSNKLKNQFRPLFLVGELCGNSLKSKISVQLLGLFFPLLVVLNFNSRTFHFAPYFFTPLKNDIKPMQFLE